MDVRLFLRIFLCSGFLLSTSCTSDDLGPARPGDGTSDSDDDDDDDDDEGSTGKKDAGKKDAGKDAGKNAGKDAGKDAGKKPSSSSEDEESEDEEIEDEELPDAGAGKKDAGKDASTPTTTRDSGSGSTATPNTPTPAPNTPAPSTPAEPTVPPASGGSGNASADPCDTATYEALVQDLFAKKCLTCHGGVKGYPDLRTKAVMVAQADAIRTRTNNPMGEFRQMPPGLGQALPQNEQDQIALWVDCGAK